MTQGAEPGLGPLDAVILCGDRGSARMVEGEAKAFLFIHGLPMFLWPAMAANQSPEVGRLFFVGNKKKLDYYLARASQYISKPTVTIEQGSTLLENAWKGFLATVDGYSDGAEKTNPSMMEKAVLYIPGDAPLVCPEEIGEFIAASDMGRFDYVAGFTKESVMERYYPSGGLPGIKMAYLHFMEGRFRINNLHLVRPFKCANREVAQMMYHSRYQKDLRNIVHLARDLFALGVNRRTLAIYAKLQAAMFLNFAGLTGASDLIRARVPMADVAGAVDAILGMRVGWAVTSRGGAALDVDNDADYETMKKMFHRWKEMQR